MSYGHLSYRQKDTALGVGIGFLVISIVMILAAIAKRLKKCVSCGKRRVHMCAHTYADTDCDGMGVFLLDLAQVGVLDGHRRCGQHLVHQLGPLLCAPVPAWVCLVTAVSEWGP